MPRSAHIAPKLVASLIVALLMIGAVPTPAFAGVVTLSVTSGNWGTAVTISGNGWSASRTTANGTRISMGGQLLRTCATNGGGNLQSCTINVPDLGPGVHVVYAEDGAVSTNTGSANFTINPATLTISPTSGPGNTNLSASGTGFSASVAMTFTADGAAMTQGACTTTSTGSFSGCTATVPWGEAGTVAIAAVAPNTRTVSTSYTRSLVKGTATVSPTSSHWGSTVAVSGSGWPASLTGGSGGTGPVVRFNGTAVATCATSDTGALTACTFTVPDTAVGSGHTVTVTDQVNPFNSASQPYTINAPSITLSPTTGAGGSSLSVSGGGFRASATVDLLFDGELRTSTPACTTNASGVFSSCSIVVPFRPAGTYNVVARDVSATGTQRSAQASYGLSLTPGTLSISPTSGRGGTVVAASGSGWTASATTATGPTVKLDGTQVTRCATTAAGALTDCSFTAPSLVAGNYTVLVTDGTNPHNGNTATFTVQAPTITLGATSGTSGSSVGVTGSGFRADAVVEFAFGTTASRSTCTANQWGVLSGCSITVPSLATTSTVSVIAADRPAGGAQRTATSTNTFTPTTVLTVSPTSGAPGDVITVSGSGWTQETIELRWGSAAGAISGASTCTANASGELTGCSFAVPSGTTGGPQTVQAVTITGAARSASAYFEVFRDTAVTVAPLTAVYGDNVSLSATLTRTNGIEALSGRTVSFSVGATPVGTATTNASGIATLPNVDLARLGVSGSPYAGAITARVPADGFDRAASGSAAITITPRSLTGTFTAAAKTYDGTTTASITGRSVSGVLSGDTVTLTGGTADFGTKHVGTGKTVTATGFTLDGTSAANYALSSAPLTTTADITAKAATIGVTVADKVYDGTAAATIATRPITGAVGGDDVAATGGTATFANKAAGAGKTVSVTGLSLAGADAGNYTFNTTASTSAVITARPLTVTATAANKVYDRNTAASVTLGDNRVAGDTLTIASDPATFDTAAVGELKTVTVPGITVTGADAGNYTANTSTTALADITPEGVTVAFTAMDKVYDGTWAATIDTVEMAGIREGDDVSVTGGTAVFLDRNVGSGKGVRWNGFTLTGADAANYELASDSVTTTADITMRTLTVSASSAGKVYDGDTDAAVTLTADGVDGDDLVLSHATAAYATKTAEAGKTIDVVGIDVTGDVAGNYTWNTKASATATISPRPLAVTVQAQDKVYDATTAAVVTLDDHRISGDVLTVNTTGGSFDSKTVGAGKTVTAAGLSLSGADAGNYSVLDTATGTAEITARALVASFTVDAKVYDRTVSATISDSGLAGVQGSDEVTVSGGTATFADAQVDSSKTATISGYSLTGADEGNYTLNPTASADASITARTLTITAAASTRVYGGTNAATVTLHDDRVDGDTLGLAYETATFDDKHAGEGKPVAVTGITVTGADAGNYTAATTAGTTGTVVGRTLVVSATGVDKVYDGSESATVTLDDDRVAGDTLTLSYTTATFDDASVGDDKPVAVTGIAVAGADAGNYTANTTEATYAAVTRRALKVTATGMDKAYDGTTSAVVTLADNRMAGDDVDTHYADAAFADKNVHSAKPVAVTGITIDGADAANYTVNIFASATAAITPRSLVVSATGVNKVYDGNDSATVTLFDDRVADDDLTTAYSAATFANHTAGGGRAISVSGITVEGDDARNYTANTTAATTAAITAKPVTAAFTAGDKTYDGQISATVAGSTVLGAVDGDEFALSAGSASFADRNAAAGKTVTWTGFALTGDDAGNYNLTNTDATATADITARALHVTATAQDKAYDGDRSATVTLLDDRVVGDVLTVTSDAALFETPDVGTDKTVEVTGISVGGADAGNYALVNTATSTVADITSPDALTVTFTAPDKVYDGSDAATVSGYELSGVTAGDDVTLTGGTATFDQPTAGARTVTWDGFSLSGAEAENYTLNATTATAPAAILPRSLTVTASAVDRVYDGTTAASAALTSAQVVDGDVVSFAGDAAFADEQAGTGKNVTVSGITIAGQDAGNYTPANTTASDTADITARPLTVSATGVDKVYDATSDATATLSDDRLPGDVLTVVAGSVVFESATVGEDKAIAVEGIAVTGGADEANYALTATTDTTSAAITAKPLTVSAAGTGKVYDGRAAATVELATADVVAGDTVTLTATGAYFDSADAGTGKPIDVVGITIAGANAANYELSNTTATTSADVTAAPLTASVTAKDKVYDGTIAATVALDTDDVIGADNVVLAHTGAAFLSAGAATDKAVDVTGITLDGADAVNYALTATTVMAAADITARPLAVVATGVDKVYDATTDATVVLAAPDTLPGDAVVATADSAAFASATAEAGKEVTVTGIAIGGSEAANYALVNATDTATAAITSKPLTVTAGAASKVYDGTTDATVALATGDVIGTDAVALGHSDAGFDTKIAGGAKPVTVTGITLSGVDAGNYELTSDAATTSADITAKSLTVTARGANRVYDATTAATVILSTADRVAGDTVTLAYGAAAFTSAAAGNGKAVSVTGITTDGTDAGNYALTSTMAATTADITAAALTATFTVADKVYDATVAADISGSNLAGVAGGDDVEVEGAAAAFADKHAGVDRSATVDGYTLAGDDAANYTVNPAATTQARITRRGLTPDASAQSKAYDGETDAQVTLLDDAVAGDVVTLSHSGATFASRHVGTDKVVTVTGIAISGGDDAGNYHLLSDTATTTANIVPGDTVTVTFTAADKVYDGTADATVSGYQLSGVDTDDDVTLTGGTVTFDGAGAGAHTVTWTDFALAGDDKDNYELGATTETAAASITAKPVAFTANAADKVYDDTTATTATLITDDVLEGDTVVPSYRNAAFASPGAGTGKAVTVTGIAIAGAQAPNYDLTATTAMTTAAITPAPLTATFTVSDKAYDGSTAGTVATSVLSGVVGEDEVSLTAATAAFANKVAEAGKTVTVSGYSLTGAAAGNYSLATSTAAATADIAQAALTASFSIDDRRYDGSADALIASSALHGVVAGDQVGLDGASAAFADKHSGLNKTVTISGYTLTGADAGNYTVNPTATKQATITRRSLTPTATAKSKTYDATAVAELDTLRADALPGDEVILDAASAVFSSPSIGDNKTVTVTGIEIAGGADADNYRLDTTTTTTHADILRGEALLVTFTASNKAYDGTTAASVTGYELQGVQAGDEVTLTGGDAAFAAAAVGEGSVTWSGFELVGAHAANYVLADIAATASATITPRAVRVTAQGIDKVYDGTTDAAVTLRTDDVVGDDAVALHYAAASFTSDAAGDAKIVHVSGTVLSGADAENYTLADTAATTAANIAPKALTASFTASNKTYNASTTATVAPAGLAGVVSGDAVSLTGAVGSFGNKQVGSGKTVTISGYSLSGTDAGNYTVNPRATTTANIAPKALTASFTASNKTYNASTTATVVPAGLAGVVSGDAVSLTGAVGSFGNKQVGSGKTVTISEYSLSGTDAGNYKVNPSATTTAAIARRPLTVTVTAATKVYDATTAAVATLHDNRVAGDALAVTSNAAVFDTPAAGSARTVNASGLAVSGTDATNYTLTSTTASTTAAITKLALYVHADPKAYRRGEPVPAWTSTFTGFVGGQGPSVLDGTLKYVIKNSSGVTVTMTSLSPSGTYKIIPSGLGSPNYKVVFTRATLTVGAMAPTVAYKPDALVSLNNSTYVGAGVINSTGVGQTVAAKVKRGGQRVFYIRVSNAGLAVDTMKLKGCSSGGGQTVKYLANATGSTIITKSVTDGAYQLTNVAPGGVRVIRAVVTVSKTATLSTRSCAVTVTSTKRATGIDTVAFTVTAVR